MTHVSLGRVRPKSQRDGVLLVVGIMETVNVKW